MSNLQKSECIEALGAALAKAQGVIKGAVKDSTNPHFKSKYADLASVWDACRGPLSANGLSIVQLPSGVSPNITLTTMLLHSSGQWISDEITVTAMKNDAQATGSVLTYLRRYSLASFCGIAQEDDDGNSASAPRHSEPEAPEVHDKMNVDHNQKLGQVLNDMGITNKRDWAKISAMLHGKPKSAESLNAAVGVLRGKPESVDEVPF